VHYYEEVRVAISVFVYQPLPEGDRFLVLAEASVDRGKLRVDGRRPDLVDESRRVFSSRKRKFVRSDRDPEEWLRSFAESFRTAQVAAAITRDSSYRDLVAPRDVIEQLQASAGLATASA
jgi:hypothetical protein